MEKVSIVCGTNRQGSNSHIVAQSIYKLLQAKGVPTGYLNLKDLPDDFVFKNEVISNPEPVLDQMVEEHVSNASHFIFILPEYNGSFPGVAKAFLDSFPPPKIHHKRALLVGVSTGRAGNLRGLEQFTGILNYLKVHVYPLKMAIEYVDKKIDPNSDMFTDETTLRLLDSAIDRFLEM